MKGFCIDGKRAFFVLFLVCFFSISCSSPCPTWQFQKGISHCFWNNTGRIILSPLDPLCGISVELVRGSYGTRMYVNVLPFEAPTDILEPELTAIELSIEDATWTIFADRFEGGQRLLLPSDVMDSLIEILLSGQSFWISIGRLKAEIVPCGFCEAYHKLISIPIYQ